MSARKTLGYRPALDGVRGVAIIGVLLAHGFPGVMDGGGQGVTVFFVLSGFLITTLLIDEHGRRGAVSLRAFYIRRAGRLFPALAVVLMATAALLLAEGARTDTVVKIIGIGASYMSNVVFGTFDDKSLGLLAIVGWTWTLSIEEQFYVVWPTVFRRLMRTSRPLTVVGWTSGGLAVLSTGWLLTLTLEGGHGMRASLGTDTRCGSLLIGCALAAYLRSGRGVPGWTAPPALLALVLVYVFPPRYWPAVSTADILLVPLASALVVGVVAQDRSTSVKRMLSFPPLVYLGTISYGVYLWNSLLQWAFFGIGVSPRNLMVLAWVPLTILVAAVSAQRIEKPCRDVARRYTQRDRSKDAGRLAVTAAV